MNESALALVGYAGWSLILVSALGAARSSLTLGGDRAPNSFQPDGSDGSPFLRRLTRTHAMSDEFRECRVHVVKSDKRGTDPTPRHPPHRAVRLPSRQTNNERHTVSSLVNVCFHPTVLAVRTMTEPLNIARSPVRPVVA